MKIDFYFFYRKPVGPIIFWSSRSLSWRKHQRKTTSCYCSSLVRRSFRSTTIQTFGLAWPSFEMAATSRTFATWYVMIYYYLFTFIKKSLPPVVRRYSNYCWKKFQLVFKNIVLRFPHKEYARNTQYLVYFAVIVCKY